MLHVLVLPTRIGSSSWCGIGSDVVVPGITFTEVCSLTTPIRPAGTYETKMSMLWSLDNKNNSAYFRYSRDGGTKWVDVTLQPSATSDIIPLTLIIPEVHVEGSQSIIVQARKDNSNDVLTVIGVYLVFESKVL